MRVEASSMLMISSATRSSISSSSARATMQPLELTAAQLVRVLAEHVGRLERHRLERAPQRPLPLLVGEARKVVRSAASRARGRP